MICTRFASRCLRACFGITLPRMTIAELMIPELKHEAEMTRRLLVRVPNAELDFSPGEGLQTIGWNASHLSEIVGWVPGIVNESGLDLDAMDAELVAATVVRSKDIAAMVKHFDEGLAKSLAALNGVSDATMAEPWTMRMGGQALFTITKNECLRKWVFTHTAHHRGILSAELRLAGVKHGSIYEE